MKPKKTILANGLRVLLVPQKNSVAATALVLVEAGSEYETKEINGLSHFLEHMCFKGTAKRPNAGQIAEELDSMGAEYNAFTGQEYTGYWAKVQSHKAGEILELIADLYLNPVFNEAEIEKERGVIIEEINMYEDTPMQKVHSVLQSVIYGDQPAGWDIAGRKDIIRALGKKDFADYRKKRYTAPATVVVVAGTMDAARMSKDINALFGKLPKAKVPRKVKTIERQERPRLALHHKESDQAHLVFGLRAFDMFDKHRYALQLLASILGGGMSSRLFRRVREQLGAAYYVRAGAELFLDHGFLSVSAGVDVNRIEEVAKAILEELRRIADEPVGKIELKKSKDHLVGSLMLSMETSDEIAGYYGGQEILTKKLITPSDLAARLRAVTPGEVQKTARFAVKNENLNMAVIGPYKDPSGLEKLLKL